MIEAATCPNYRGIWLDFYEFDKLEGVVFDDEAYTGFSCMFSP